ncbi:ABC-F family ATP-binding cassette domain-containing protein [Butyrivibrio sp. MC2013]|uniref:ABC-F family ATP-binding cassette domain-containing protein n=1 Tax=Butyrivibrio sp. MC2013 TaxID=1280686 RepID=UPI00040F4922|nr:ABC-F family ATP-binding cassette domain-containing protein [Butyrivibrio sp. MC2013]
MLFDCHSVSKAFDGKEILKNISFHMEEREKCAIVGINGAGKTTLLKILTGEMEADEGSVVFARDSTFAYLAQNQNIDMAGTVISELELVKKDTIEMEEKIRDAEERMKHLTGKELEALMEEYERLSHLFAISDGYAWRSQVQGVARGLGFSDEEFGKNVATLSGGQKTRLALGKLLLEEPDLIILDEPTNHLDMNSIRWLENYLLNYKKAVLIVSHDRYFLDKTASKVIEIENGQAEVYNGNYSFYSAEKEKRRYAKMRAYLNQQQEIKHQQAVIDKLKSYNREKSIKRAESREKMLSKMELIDKPQEINDEMNFKLTPSCESGNDVLKVESISKSFGDARLFEDISFEIKKGEHVAIIGDNGTGKTTMLKMINNLLPPDSGKITLGVKVYPGYYDQEHHVLHDEKTLFEEISDEYPSMTNTEIRNTLAAFLFTGEDVFKRIGDLSGGEKGRVSLAKLMLSKSNFLLLDEPTNHLDITSKEILETAINNYEGTVLYVSHDRYFINRTATRILDLTRGVLVSYIGNYDYYLAHQEERMSSILSGNRAATASGAASGVILGKTGSDIASNKNGSLNMKGNSFQYSSESSSGSSQADWKAQKAQAAQKKKLEKALKSCEDKIAELEDRNAVLDEEISRPEIATDLAELRIRTDEQDKNNNELETLYTDWERLSEELGSMS